MIERILLAVDDTPDSLAAARLAVELAGSLHAGLRIVHVSADHLLDTVVEAASGEPAAGMRRAQSAAVILTRVAGLAEAAGVAAETTLLAGDSGPTVLHAAREWQADLVVVGKSARSATGEPTSAARPGTSSNSPTARCSSSRLHSAERAAEARSSSTGPLVLRRSG